jgi:tetratricopeptide (TPR) repeat protein
MDPLPQPDAVHLRAAEGWLDLGNHQEAAAELQRITPVNRTHPDVLHLRWRVHAAAEQWDTSLKIAEGLTAVVPERRFGWVHRGFSLRKLDRQAEALAVYQEAADRFGMNPTFALGLACCHARLGDLAEAKRHLELAMDLAEDKAVQDRLKLRALDEPDLEPLWRNLGPAGE